MNMQSPPTSVAERLRAVIDAGELPPAAAQHGAKLLERLEAPVRLVFLGWPNPRRSTLFNAICGASILPPQGPMPSVELSFGVEPTVTATMADGTTAQSSGSLSGLDMSGAVFAHAQQPLPILQRISLTNVVADAAEEDQLAAINWILPRTDIAIWCSDIFGAEERELWEKVPDALVDHAYLVLTAADQNRAKTLRSELSADFRDVFSVDCGRLTDESGLPDLDTPLWAEIGGAGLTEQIFRHIEAGQQADTDGALMFLNRYGPKEDAPVAKDPAPTAEATPIKVISTPIQVEEAVVPIDFYRNGLDLLRIRARELMSVAKDESGPATSAILGECCATIEELSELAMAQVDVDDPRFDALSDTIFEAESLIVLLQLENEAGPAADAVTVLLQLRRDFEACLAA